MTFHAVTIHLPSFLYDHIRRRAEDAHRSIEAELLDLVATALLTESLRTNLQTDLAGQENLLRE